MELKTVVYYRNAYAHFTVTREHKGVYCADLVAWDGPADQTPPACIILIRGERKWWGSASDPDLIKALSDAILSLPESGLFYRERNSSSETAEENA
jgi:hypothetical protein